MRFSQALLFLAVALLVLLTGLLLTTLPVIMLASRAKEGAQAGMYTTGPAPIAIILLVSATQNRCKIPVHLESGLSNLAGHLAICRCQMRTHCLKDPGLAG